MIKILFICHGNICRSPMAEFILRDMLERTGKEGEIAVSSAAVRNLAIRSIRRRAGFWLHTASDARGTRHGR